MEEQIMDDIYKQLALLWIPQPNQVSMYHKRAVCSGTRDLHQGSVLHQCLNCILEVHAPMLLVKPVLRLGLAVDLGKGGSSAVTQAKNDILHQAAVLPGLVLPLG